MNPRAFRPNKKPTAVFRPWNAATLGVCQDPHALTLDEKKPFVNNRYAKYNLVNDNNDDGWGSGGSTTVEIDQNKNDDDYWSVKAEITATNQNNDDWNVKNNEESNGGWNVNNSKENIEKNEGWNMKNNEENGQDWNSIIENASEKNESSSENTNEKRECWNENSDGRNECWNGNNNGKGEEGSNNTVENTNWSDNQKYVEGYNSTVEAANFNNNDDYWGSEENQLENSENNNSISEKNNEDDYWGSEVQDNQNNNSDNVGYWNGTSENEISKENNNDNWNVGGNKEDTVSIPIPITTISATTSSKQECPNVNNDFDRSLIKKLNAISTTDQKHNDGKESNSHNFNQKIITNINNIISNNSSQKVRGGAIDTTSSTNVLSLSPKQSEQKLLDLSDDEDNNSPAVNNNNKKETTIDTAAAKKRRSADFKIIDVEGFLKQDLEEELKKMMVDLMSQNSTSSTMCPLAKRNSILKDSKRTHEIELKISTPDRKSVCAIGQMLSLLEYEDCVFITDISSAINDDVVYETAFGFRPPFALFLIISTIYILTQKWRPASRSHDPNTKIITEKIYAKRLIAFCILCSTAKIVTQTGIEMSKPQKSLSYATYAAIENRRSDIFTQPLAGLTLVKNLSTLMPGCKLSRKTRNLWTHLWALFDFIGIALESLLRMHTIETILNFINASRDLNKGHGTFFIWSIFSKLSKWKTNITVYEGGEEAPEVFICDVGVGAAASVGLVGVSDPLDNGDDVVG
nr:10430_t:CDS:10 [Entrophospora candida]